jgi:signal transduction histidine kinase
MALYRRMGHGAMINSGDLIEVPARTRSGDEIRVELSLAALEHPAGSARYVLATLRDTSDRRRADLHSLGAARAESARAEADQTLRQQQQLFQAGADDLRHELANLQRSTRRLTSGRPERSIDRARVVDARTRKVSGMLEELATLAAIQARQLELEPERVNLVPLVGRAVANMRTRGTPCRLNAAMPQGLTALVDPKLIEQLVVVLLELAVRRNPHGCWIDVELRRPLVGLARLEVRDVGRSLSKSLREHLVSPAAWDRGLVMSRSIAELHGGTLDVEFPPEGGVSVVVTLPTQRGRVLQRAV